jgi:hypothetical protein
MSASFLPSSWWPAPAALLREDPRTYDGPRSAVWGAVVWLIFITVRSCIHLLAPDGGAHSIATIDIAVAGGKNIEAMFGQWGASQLQLALLLWVLLLRWRGLVPLVLLVCAAEPCLRGFAASLKPLITEGTAPGVALNWLVLPPLVLLLWISLCPAVADARQSSKIAS